MPDNRRILSPQTAPRSSWSAENLPTADQEPKAIIRKFINSAIYVEKTVMPPLRKKSPIEITSISDSKTRPILTDRSVKRCTCITSPQLCPCHPLIPHIERAQTENTSETSSTSSSDVGSQITVKSKDHSTENPTDLKLSLCSLHSERTTTNIDPKEKEEYIKNWLRKKAEERKKKELEEEKIKIMKEKEKEMIIEKEKQNFKRWLANKKLEEERQKAEKEKKEQEIKLKEMKKEQRRTMNTSTYNQWLNRKKRAELEKNIREKLALLEILEEKQRRFEASQTAFENWVRTSKNRPKPVPLNQGLKNSCMSQFTLPYQPIKDALFLHNVVSSNLTIRDCVFRPANAKNLCPDPDIKYFLYTDGEKQEVDYTQTDWLRQSIWNSTKENVFLIHGYAGGDDDLPMVVLRDAYIRNGSYNVWVVDWGNLSPPPCYRAAVNNMRATARCTGELLSSLRIAGLPSDKVTCVGHSLGAHVCGLISQYVLFRMHRIIGLDPARPLINQQTRLSEGDAAAVHVLHTNAGNYGEMGRNGHVDFCINGGRIQPYCENADIDAQLCSHVWAICYMAESLVPDLSRRAEPCSRRCPTGSRPGIRVGIPIVMGQDTPLTATGSYCIQDKYPPYCPKKSGDIGDKRCCLIAPQSVSATTEMNVFKG